MKPGLTSASARVFSHPPFPPEYLYSILLHVFSRYCQQALFLHQKLKVKKCNFHQKHFISKHFANPACSFRLGTSIGFKLNFNFSDIRCATHVQPEGALDAYLIERMCYSNVSLPNVANL